MERENSYDPIEDWSREGRLRLVNDRGEEIRMLLDLAFTSFVDRQSTGLSAFGFHAEDPVAEAVDWCLGRFVGGELDPARLHPGSRSLRLFTEVPFWLQQKVGRNGYSHIVATARAVVGRNTLVASSGDTGGEADGVAIDVTLQRFARELATRLSELRLCTCPDLIGFWLDGTAILRREWFGWREAGTIAEGGARLSKKQRSLYAHDAMFRFLCCFCDLTSAPPTGPAEHALLLTTLSPCENTPPYRVPDRDVAPQLVRLGAKGPREVAQLRKRGAGSYVRLCIERMSSVARQEPVDILRVELVRRSMGRTTLYALGIDDDMALRQVVDLFCSAAPEVS